MNIGKYLQNRNKKLYPFIYQLIDLEYNIDKKYVIRSAFKCIERSDIIRKVNQLNKRKIRKLNEYLVKKEYSTTYIKSIVQSISYVCENYLVPYNYLLKNPTKGYHVIKGRKSSLIKAIPSKYLAIIERTNFDTLSQQFAADLFLFCSRTGMSFCDSINLKYQKIEDGEDGLWINGFRQKNNREFLVPLDEKSNFIIEKYKNKIDSLYFKKKTEEYVFPHIRRQTYYFILQKIGKKIKIKDEGMTLSPHKGRHTFATEMLKNGVSIESIKKMLGHSQSSDVTWLYAEINKEKIKKEVFKNQLLI